MNAYAHGASCRGRRDRGLAVLVALLTVCTSFPSAVADQTSLPDGSVVISDGVVDQGLLPNDIDGLGGVAYGEENPTMQGMPQMPLAECGPRWFVAVDALMLWQGNATRSPLLLDQEGATALDVGTMRTELSAGPRFSVIRSLGDCHAIEGNFFQVSPFHSTASAPATGVPYSVVGTAQLPPFADVDSATAAGSGLIKSAELNWRHNNCCNPFTWLAGFRWVELNSQLNVDYAYTIPGDTPTFGTGSIDVQSGNNLYGGQAGFDVRLWNKGGSWRVNGIGKAGLFANADAYQRSTAFVTDGGPPVSPETVAASANQVAFFGEAGLNATYCITHWLAWRAGYTVFWANGVAVAAQQLPNNDFNAGTTTIDTTGSMMLHGVNTGFEARW